MRALSTLRGLRGAPEAPPLCRETQSLRQQMLELSCENAMVGTNGLRELPLQPRETLVSRTAIRLIGVAFPVLDMVDRCMDCFENPYSGLSC